MINRSANAGGKRRVFLVRGKGFANAHGYALGLFLASFRENQSKFVAAVTGSSINRAAMKAQDVRNAAKSAAANEVAVGVVNRLQAIQVEKEHGKGTPGAQGAFGFRVQHIEQLAIVGKAGERVAGRKMPYLFERLGAVEQSAAKQDGIAQHVHRLRKNEGAVEKLDRLASGKLRSQVQPNRKIDGFIKGGILQIFAPPVTKQSNQKDDRRQELQRIGDETFRVMRNVRRKLPQRGGNEIGGRENGKQAPGDFQLGMARAGNKVLDDQGHGE